MNKRYIDFVPKQRSGAKRKVASPEVGRISRGEPIVEKVTVEKYIVETPMPGASLDEVLTDVPARPLVEAPVKMATASKPVNFGVIEELDTKFVKTDVEKRPLSRGRPAKKPAKKPVEKSVEKAARAPVGYGASAMANQAVIEAANRQIMAGQPAQRTVVRSTKVVRTKAEVQASAEAARAMTIPSSPFINQGKVEKRPLSRNVYQKKIVPTKEDSRPVTIVTGPEKGKHLSIIVTIIITVILGAAAGTVAFLLLPK